MLRSVSPPDRAAAKRRPSGLSAVPAMEIRSADFPLADYNKISVAVTGLQPWRTSWTHAWRSASLAASRSASGSGNPASISTCRRQLSTLDCSSSRHTGVSIASAIGARCFVLPLTIPTARKLAEMSGTASAGVEPLGEFLPGEDLDRPLELALKTGGRLFPGLAEALVERLHRDLRVPLDLPLGHPREPLGLPALPLDQDDVEPGANVGLGTLDGLGDRMLALPEPLGDLVDRAAALERLRLELVERPGDSLSR